MKLTRKAKRSVLFVALAMLALPASASAATTIGALPLSTNTGSCPSNCLVIQDATSPGFNPYVSSANGVVTRFVTRSGTTLSAADRFRFLVFSPATPPEWKLTGAGEFEGWDALTGGFVDAPNVFGVRVPIKINDRIALNALASGGNSSTLYMTGGVGDTLRTVPGATNVGDVSSGSVVSTGTGYRLNLQAVIEPDTDGDGYGDESQDLCLGVVGPASGCKGTLLGSPLTSAATSAGGANETFLQTSLPGSTSIAPFDGVVLRWGVKGSSNASTDRLQLLRPSGSGYDVVGQSATASTIAATQLLIGGATRLPIKAGDRIAASGTGSIPTRYLPNSANTLARFAANPSSGDHLGSPASENHDEALFAAVIEPDADHDNFGDTTEDACPTDPSTQGPCTKPVISGFKFTPRTFAVNTKGAVISAAKVKKGSTISLSLSKAARVTFTVKLKLKGRKVGNKCVAPTKKNKSKKSCTYYPKSYTFSRDLPAGTSKFSYSGRHKVGTAKKSLAKGSYVATAYPFDLTGQLGGATATTDFKIVAAPKKKR
jgi:hypothetical protein